MGLEEGRTTLSFNGADAFNVIYRQRFLPALAEIVPSAAPFAANLYALEPPKFLFCIRCRGVGSGQVYAGSTTSTIPISYSSCCHKCKI